MKIQDDDYKSANATLESHLKIARNKIALLYADGNALGAIVRNLEKDEMKDFSRKLDKATKDAFKNAYESTKQNIANNDSFKIREVICGGDDLVVVCNADIALDFAKNFLAHFENGTQDIYRILFWQGSAKKSCAKRWDLSF